jgi:hypothetical protein
MRTALRGSWKVSSHMRVVIRYRNARPKFSASQKNRVLNGCDGVRNPQLMHERSRSAGDRGSEKGKREWIQDLQI